MGLVQAWRGTVVCLVHEERFSSVVRLLPPISLPGDPKLYVLTEGALLWISALRSPPGGLPRFTLPSDNLRACLGEKLRLGPGALNFEARLGHPSGRKTIDAALLQPPHMATWSAFGRNLIFILHACPRARQASGWLPRSCLRGAGRHESGSVDFFQCLG